MSATIAMPEQHARNRLKEFLIFRVHEPDGHGELSDDSALEAEAVRYSDLMADAEPEEGVHYEVRASGSGTLLHSTADPEDENEGPSWTHDD